MAWTASLLSKTQSRDKWVFVVQFTDGTETLNEQIEASTTDPLWLAKTVKGKLAKLDARSTVDAGAPLGTITPPADPPPVDPAPGVFRNELHKLVQMMKAVDLGVIPPTLPALISLQNQIKTAVQADPTLLNLF